MTRCSCTHLSDAHSPSNGVCRWRDCCCNQFAPAVTEPDTTMTFVARGNPPRPVLVGVSPHPAVSPKDLATPAVTETDLCSSCGFIHRSSERCGPPTVTEPDMENRIYRIVKRAANMGGCSQTHHEHLMRDARKVVAALATPAVMDVERLTAMEEAVLRETAAVAPPGPFWTNDAMLEVLATLDAERALATPVVTETADALAKVAATVKGLDEYWCEPNDTGHGHVRTVAVLRAIENLAAPAVMTTGQDYPTPTWERAVCVCGAEPPSRPWTPDVANPCRDGNGNWRPGHGYATPAVTKPDLQAALEAYEADPVNIHDRPESWAKLDALLEAVRAALTEQENTP